MKSKKLLFILITLCTLVVSKKSKPDEKPDWAKKDIRDFSDADMERLLDQWEEDEEPLEEDELPEHLRPPVKLPTTLGDDPQKIIELSKKGRTLMTFVNVAGNPTKEEAEETSKLWQTSLWNSHIQAERYLIDDNRAIFLFKDGSQAWTAKDYLINQEKCESVTIEGKVYPGKHTKKNKEEL